jgi:uncharacterized protein YgiM (DUF1202 family)
MTGITNSRTGRPWHGGTALAAIAIAGLCLNGCTGIANGITGLQSRYGDPKDGCHAYRQPLIDAGNQFSKSMVTAALGGAAAGAAVGAAADSKNRAQGAIFGLISGAVLAMAINYYSAKQRQAKTRAELVSSIDADAANDSSEMLTTNNAISGLTRCRQTQIASVEQQYRSHILTAEQAKQQLQQIKVSVDADNQLIKTVLGDSGNREQIYVKARADASGIQDPAAGYQQQGYGQPSSGQIGFSHPPSPPPSYNPPPSPHTAPPSTSTAPPATGGDEGGSLVAAKAINVRGGPSTNNSVVDHLQAGEPVMVGSDAGNGWVAVNHNGTQGYVLKSLLTQPGSVPPPTTGTAQATGAPGTGTSHFVRLNNEAKTKADEHEQVDNDLEAKINDLSTIVG